MSAKELTQVRLKELVHYDKNTGRMVWIKPTSTRVKVGDVVGSNDGRGYLQTSIDGQRYRVHRLAWLWIYGVLPTNHIDHIDRNRANNRITNLRDLPQALNNQNIGITNTNTSGFLGVSWSKAMKKWEARISINNKGKVLGYFDRPEEASNTYQLAKKLHHEATVL